MVGLIQVIVKHALHVFHPNTQKDPVVLQLIQYVKHVLFALVASTMMDAVDYCLAAAECVAVARLMSIYQDVAAEVMEHA